MNEEEEGEGEGRAVVKLTRTWRLFKDNGTLVGGHHLSELHTFKSTWPATTGFNRSIGLSHQNWYEGKRKEKKERERERKQEKVCMYILIFSFKKTKKKFKKRVIIIIVINPRNIWLQPTEPERPMNPWKRMNNDGPTAKGPLRWEGNWLRLSKV